MKICILTSGHEPTDERIFSKEIMSLKKNGYNDITIIAPYDKEYDEISGIKILGFSPRKSNNIKDRFNPLIELAKKAEECRADLYHCHEPDALKVGIKMKKKFGSKVIYDAHEYHPEHFAERYPGIKGKCIYNLVYKFEKYYATKADAIFTVNDELVQKFTSWGCSAYYIPNYATICGDIKLKTIEVVEMLKKDLFTIGVFVGGMYEARGLIEMILANKILMENGEKVAFIFAGWADEQYTKKLRDIIEENKLEHCVKLIGKIGHDDVINLLSQCDFGILNDYADKRNINSLAVKLFEYMQCGLPILASNLPAKKELLNKYNCGVVATRQDPKDIADAILLLCKDKDKMKSMGLNGKKAFLEKYNWTKIEETLIEVYRKLEAK